LFGWGIYDWWFTGALLAEFLIATAIWIGAFLFTIIGVPLVRRKARIISSNE
jgi:putative Mn2+ efflux pump MntP